jgi:hypothetical protein
MSMQMQLPAELPNIENARLPETYQNAKGALAACVKIDECREWAIKAEALASYARQSKDTDLRKMADRIQARAVDRCGELLKQIPNGSGGDRHSNSFKNDSRVTFESPRQQAAHKAGLSTPQATTAIRVHNVPRDMFETMVEGDNPPTVKKLAQIGTKKRQQPIVDLGERTPKEFQAATALTGLIEDFLSEAIAMDIDLALRGCDEQERKKLLTSVQSSMQWMSKLQKTIRSGKWRTAARNSPKRSPKKSTTSAKKGRR